MEERRKASQDGICVERLGKGKRDARKWMRIEGRGWDRWKEKKVKGCKKINGRDGRGFNVRDGICRGRKRDGRK